MDYDETPLCLGCDEPTDVDGWCYYCAEPDQRCDYVVERPCSIPDEGCKCGTERITCRRRRGHHGYHRDSMGRVMGRKS